MSRISLNEFPFEQFSEFISIGEITGIIKFNVNGESVFLKQISKTNFNLYEVRSLPGGKKYKNQIASFRATSNSALKKTLREQLDKISNDDV